MGRLAVKKSCGVAPAVSDGCKHILGRIRGSNVLPVFDREVMKGEEFVPVLGQFGASPLSFVAMGFKEKIQGSTRAYVFVSAIQIPCNSDLAFPLGASSPRSGYFWTVIRSRLALRAIALIDRLVSSSRDSRQSSLN